MAFIRLALEDVYKKNLSMQNLKQIRNKKKVSCLRPATVPALPTRITEKGKQLLLWLCLPAWIRFYETNTICV